MLILNKKPHLGMWYGFCSQEMSSCSWQDRAYLSFGRCVDAGRPKGSRLVQTSPVSFLFWLACSSLLVFEFKLCRFFLARMCTTYTVAQTIHAMQMTEKNNWFLCKAWVEKIEGYAAVNNTRPRKRRRWYLMSRPLMKIANVLEKRDRTLLTNIELQVFSHA